MHVIGRPVFECTSQRDGPHQFMVDRIAADFELVCPFDGSPARRVLVGAGAIVLVGVIGKRSWSVRVLADRVRNASRRLLARERELARRGVPSEILTALAVAAAGVVVAATLLVR